MNYTVAAPACACGMAITKRFKSGKFGKYCNSCMSRNCGKLSVVRAAGECAVCERPLPTKVSPGPVRKYCDQRCRWRACKSARYVPKGERAFSCSHCNARFVATHKRRYCSPDCLAKASAARVLRQRRAKNKLRPPINCGSCGALFCVLLSAPPSIAYCDPCMELRAGSVYSVARRKRIKAVKDEHVDRIKVFERDNWRCQICGVKTIREPYKARSAELDHVIPLSRGGQHSYANTQCACRKCNGSKSATPRGQMWLPGLAGAGISA